MTDHNIRSRVLAAHEQNRDATTRQIAEMLALTYDQVRVALYNAGIVKPRGRPKTKRAGRVRYAGAE